MSDDQRLGGKIGIVTGGGSGYGAELARSLAAAGAKLCIGDINPDRAERVATSIREAGGDAFGWQLDIANKFQVSAMIETTRDRYQYLDFLVQCAHVGPQESVLKMDEWDWRRTVEVNLTGTFICAQLCARVLADERGGAILLTIRPPDDDRSAGSAAVAATQAGIAGLAEAMAAELAGQGVRIKTHSSRSPQDVIAYLTQ